MQSEVLMEKEVYMAPERVDAKNVKDVKKELDALIDSGATELIFDMSQMKYISSAGLRMLVETLKKLNDGFALSNVPLAVKEILKMTGLTNIIKII